MADFNTIATLVAADSELTSRGFKLEYNRDRYLPPAEDNRYLGSRDPTPIPGEEIQQLNDEDQYQFEHRLRLSFDKPPKDASRGFVFGWGPDCDIQLVDRTKLLPGDFDKVKHVRSAHFHITFDERRRLVLRDTSTVGTSVSYHDQAGNERRSFFTWIILPKIESIEVNIPWANISFFIQLNREYAHQDFIANIDALFPPGMRVASSGLAAEMQQLNMRSRQTSLPTSGKRTPGYGPIYLRGQAVGRGSFAVVRKVMDVSTGNIHAGKVFLKRTDCAREVATMRNLTHEHIVQFIDYRDNPQMIVMEYVPLGSLRKECSAAPITFEETLIVLDQALQAVVYLNSRGYVHRDIKPDNILVSSRQPLAIKLGDLGVTKHDRNGLTEFRTIAGTWKYLGPEVYMDKENPYTCAVDIWSLGIVALELAYGLSKSPEKSKMAEWLRYVSECIRSSGSDMLIDFLRQHMLRLEPARRLSASQCLQRIVAIRGEFASPVAATSEQPGPLLQEASQVITIVQKARASGQRERASVTRSNTDSSEQTIILPAQGELEATAAQNIYMIKQAGLFYPEEQDPVYLSVSELLEDIQLSDGISDHQPVVEIRTLCRHLERLGIETVKAWTDHERELTVITAITETREFIIATLNSSDLASSKANLARRFNQIISSLVPD